MDRAVRLPSLVVCLALSATLHAATPTTTLLSSSSPNPSLPCQALTFTAIVTAEGGAIPTGTVVLTFGDQANGPLALVNGVATTTLLGYYGRPICKSGSHSVIATYNGDASFLGSNSNTLTQTIRKGVPGDFDGDGKADIVRRSPSGWMERWIMDGPVIRQTNHISAYSQSVRDEVLRADICSMGHFLHEDGHADLAFCMRDGGLRVWVTTSLSSGVNSGWPKRIAYGQSVVAIDDFSGNGTSDALLRDAAGAVFMWVIDGEAETRFSIGNPGVDYEVVGTGDFDGDGKADILFRDSQGGLGMWLMNGPSIIGGGYVGAPGVTYRVAGVGDFDGDEKADILLRAVDGGLAICLMNGTTIVLGTTVAPLDLSYSVVAVRDYDGDRRADILLRDINGTIGMWLMSGTAIRSGAHVRWSGFDSTVH